MNQLIKSIRGLTLCFILMSISTISKGQTFSIDSLFVYGGISYIPIKTVDFFDVHISDWERFGLGTSEGRVEVPLLDNAPGSSPGLALGAHYFLNETWSGSVDLTYTFSGINLIQALLGVHYKIMDGSKFSIALSPRIGYSMANGEIGTTEILPGKTPPVILDEGTFDADESLKVEFSGVLFQAGITPVFEVSDRLRIIANVNYGLNFARNATLRAGGIEIPFTSNGVVRSDGSNTQAGINPEVKNQGVGVSVSVAFRVN